ncbi:hypothetical protein [Rhodococcus phenolicus]
MDLVRVAGAACCHIPR